MSSGWFITGTDTGIGKTALTACLLAAARQRGLSAICMKPVQTGAESEAPGHAPDAEFALRMAGFRPPADTLQHVAPYCYLPACSPHLAAAEANRPIHIEVIATALAELQRAYDLVWVEGAGGAWVPLDDRLTMLDLMNELSLPVLIASRPGLGTINHTSLTVEALRNRGLRVDGVVFVESEPTEWGMIEKDNRTTIERITGVPVLGVLPYCPGLDEAGAAPQALLDAGSLFLDLLDARR